MSQSARRAFAFFRTDLQRKQVYLAETLTEEWRVTPGALELAWFAEEVDAMTRSLDALSARIAQLEAK
jgi:ubiquinone biosynthesis protein UbiJ